MDDDDEEALERRKRARERRRRNWDAEDLDCTVTRDEAMMEGQRILLDNLREKVASLEERSERVEREKRTLHELLSARKADHSELQSEMNDQISQLEDACRQLEEQNQRLLERLQLPPETRASVENHEKEIQIFQQRLCEEDAVKTSLAEENVSLRGEIAELHVEMDEMHDQFREDEALEFRELQKELEATAKNCRILQYKLRKAERRTEQVEVERLLFEEKLRQLDERGVGDDKRHVSELQEELKMAKEVSVRLHDELEAVEERRLRYQQEVDRLEDYLRESESRREALQKEVDLLNSEIDELRAADTPGTLLSKTEVSLRKRPPLNRSGSGSRDGSQENDVEKLMRDLSDSLEREHDMKEQLRFAEEEAATMRKKLAEVDAENESLTLQVERMSEQRTTDALQDGHVIGKTQQELRLQLELAEQEVTVLRRRSDEAAKEKEQMLTSVKQMQERVGQLRKSDNDELQQLPYEERIEAVAKDIENLRKRLIEKDREDSKKKKKAKEEETKSEEELKHEMKSLRHKLDKIEVELDGFPRALDQLRVRTVTSDEESTITDDEEVKTRVKELEKELKKLRAKIKKAEESCENAAKEIDKFEGKKGKLEKEAKEVSRRIGELDTSSENILRELSDAKRAKKKRKKDDNSSEEENLQEKFKQLEQEIDELRDSLSGRDDDVARLETELRDAQANSDGATQQWRDRETSLQAQLSAAGAQINVMENLLETTTSHLGSLCSDATSPSTDVLLRKVESLDSLLRTERKKLAAAAKKAALKDVTQSSLEDSSLVESEKKILQHELMLCERQLEEANEQVKELRERLEKLQESKDAFVKEREDSLMKGEATVSTETVKAAKEPASWKWEKQELERHVKELKKKSEDLSKQLSKRKDAGGDGKGDDEASSREELEENLKKVNEQNEKLQKSSEKTKQDLCKLEELIHSKDARWEEERKVLEQDKKSALKEASLKDDILKQKDDIIKQKDCLVEQRNQVIKERDQLISSHEAENTQSQNQLQQQHEQLTKVSSELNSFKEKLQEAERQLKENDRALRKSDEVLRQRDDRLKEKDDILERMNRTSKEKEGQIKDMDTAIRKTMKKLEDRDSEVKKLRVEAKNANARNEAYADQVAELEKQLLQLKQELISQMEMFNEKKKQIENLLDKVVSEKSATLEQLQSSQKLMATKENNWRKEEDNLNRELNLIRDRYNMLKADNQLAKDQLDTKLDEIERKEVELNERMEEKEREKQIQETKCKELQDELKALRRKIELSDDNPDKKEFLKEMWMEKERTTQAKIDTIIMAEKVALEQAAKGKLRILEEQAEQAWEEVDTARQEAKMQRQLLRTSAIALADIKKRYDQSSLCWNEDRIALEKQTFELKQKRDQISELQKIVDDLNAKLAGQQNKAIELEAKLGIQENEWRAEKLKLHTSLNKVEEQTAKPLNKFKQLEKRDVMLEKERTERGKLISDAQALNRELNKRLAEAQQRYTEAKKEFSARADEIRASWTSEQRALRDRVGQLEREAQRRGPCQGALVDVQFALQMERTRWQGERAELHRLLDDARRSNLREKQRLNQLLAEAKKIQTLAPSIDVGSTTRGGDNDRSSSAEVEVKPSLETSADTIDETMDEHLKQALKHISSLAEELNKLSPKVERRFHSKSTNSFRRSLSTSEVDVDSAATPNAQLFVSSGRAHPEMRRSQSTTENSESPARTSGPPVTRRAPHYTTFSLSGSQSAFSSRDPSPDNPRYPAPPPNFFITPPVTSGESSGAMTPDKRDSQRLANGPYSTYQHRSVSLDRGGQSRALSHSVSVDNSAYARLMSSDYDDAPVTETTPASVRIGDVVILPGSERLRTPSRSSSQASPRSLRKRFYEDFEEREREASLSRDFDRKDATRSSDGSRRIPVVVTSRTSRREDFTRGRSEPRKVGALKSTGSDVSSRLSNDELDRDKQSSTSNIFTNARRKIFGSLRSLSQDNSNSVRSSVAQIGLHVLPSAAVPSNFAPPDVVRKERRWFFGKRASSVGPESTTSSRRSVPRNDSSNSPESARHTGKSPVTNLKIKLKPKAEDTSEEKPKHETNHQSQNSVTSKITIDRVPEKFGKLTVENSHPLDEQVSNKVFSGKPPGKSTATVAGKGSVKINITKTNSKLSDAGTKSAAGSGSPKDGIVIPIIRKKTFVNNSSAANKTSSVKQIPINRVSSSGTNGTSGEPAAKDTNNASIVNGARRRSESGNRISGLLARFSKPGGIN